MTHGTNHARHRPARPAAATLAALVLAGCSSGHVGEDWQCPLAEGGACASVAAADPAVPDPDRAGNAVLAEPLYRVRDGVGRAGAPAAAARCAAECGAGLDPFGWLARLFGADGGNGRSRSTESAPEPADAVASSPAVAKNGAPSAAPMAAGLPGISESAGRDAGGGDLRTGDIVARIWIAPFVDGHGVYREASHVRVVLEPAGWRLK